MLLLLAFLPLALSQSLTLYTATYVTPTTTSLAPGETYTGLPAYDPTVLTPPTPPSPPTTSYTISLPPDALTLQNDGYLLSIPQKGNFLGFSIELSVADVVLGKSPTTLKVPFLNYMANIQNRAGQGPIVRVGGNTQDSSTIFADGLPDDAEIEKVKSAKDQYGNSIVTPLVNYSPLLFYTMAVITSLVGAQWYFGIAFNETDVSGPTGNEAIAVEYAQRILGSNLLGVAVGNEPDLYTDHGDRPTGWNLDSYLSEYDAMTASILSTNPTNPLAFVGPSVCCQVEGFLLTDVIAAGYLNSSRAPNIAKVTVQHYPTNNCQINGNIIDPQDIFGSFLNHTGATSLVDLYTADSAAVQAAGKELVMLEMNTASCGGFAGLSDSFGAAMWMTDYALQMAYGNFSSALMHVGGQNVYYNPFTPPPSNLSSIGYQWTTGSVYYPTLLIAEAFGKSNASQVADLTPLTNSIYAPIYGIYENNAPTRVVLFNYVSDTTGASDYTATVSLNGTTLSATSVSVRYFRAPTVSEQYDITWANQTLGNSFASDGRLQGDLETVVVQCSNGECQIPVYAPSIALVFLTDQAVTDSSVNEGATQTYSTTVIGTGSATVDPGVLETSNGQNGGKVLGSTSEGSSGAGERRATVGVVGMGLGLLAGVLGLLW